EDPRADRCPGGGDHAVVATLWGESPPGDASPGPACRPEQPTALVIQYSGAPIIRESLFRYLVSYRSHSGFHEATVEQIFMDLLERCGCQRLSVWARFMRRGGIDINPHRSNWDSSAPLIRLPQQ
ncbi:MAG: hypothetical protein ACR2PZ_15795, partial [Pseudomonadales bacterium]